MVSARFREKTIPNNTAMQSAARTMCVTRAT